MSIKTDQLRHSLHQLDHLTTKLNIKRDTFSDAELRDHLVDTITGIQDALTIIYHILIEAK